MVHFKQCQFQSADVLSLSPFCLYILTTVDFALGYMLCICFLSVCLYRRPICRLSLVCANKSYFFN